MAHNIALELVALIQHIHGNGVQLVSSLSQSKAIPDAQIATIQGALIGSKTTNNHPILICSHYDSMSPAAVSKQTSLYIAILHDFYNSQVQLS